MTSVNSGGKVVGNVPTVDADLGRAVRVGIRPEHLVPAEPGKAVCTGVVTITEALGEVTLLYIDAGEGRAPIVAKLPGIHQGLRHKPVALGAEPDKIHLFADGQSLLYR